MSIDLLRYAQKLIRLGLLVPNPYQFQFDICDNKVQTKTCLLSCNLNTFVGANFRNDVSFQ